VNPLRRAVPASRKPRATFPGLPFDACVSPLRAAGKTFRALAILLLAESPVVCHRGKPRRRMRHWAALSLRRPSPGWPSVATRPTHALDPCFSRFETCDLVPPLGRRTGDTFHASIRRHPDSAEIPFQRRLQVPQISPLASHLVGTADESRSDVHLLYAGYLSDGRFPANSRHKRITNLCSQSRQSIRCVRCQPNPPVPAVLEGWRAEPRLVAHVALKTPSVSLAGSYHPLHEAVSW